MRLPFPIFLVHATVNNNNNEYIKSPTPGQDVPEVALHEGVRVLKDLAQAQFLRVGIASALANPRVDHLALALLGLDPGQYQAGSNLVGFRFTTQQYLDLIMHVLLLWAERGL